MPESQQPAGHDEALLDRLFGTVEELEAENQRRNTIYPQFRHEHTEAPRQSPQRAETKRERIVASMLKRIDRMHERYESD